MPAAAEPAAGRDDAGGRADRIAAAVTAVPGVAGLHPGMFGEAATYLPGRRVAGIRVGERGVDIHVSVRFGVPIAQVAERIRAAVAAIDAGPVSIMVEDVLPAGADGGA
ncbi:Asp23/Gls24 family envelope stress response protein [Nocardia higoensis]|uniref:Asp23/Gls24 family envelope stress response protein n=1 Tax=Nocardia higoensis TaxID=228599 RepID=UPI00030ED952|nr:Asp23/Gls24 family envelope stress response protein [Nocardia higoensis]